MSAGCTVVSVPAEHPFVAAVLPRGQWADIQAYAPRRPRGVAPGQWYPSPVLEPAWLRTHADRFEVVHVHFGFEHRSVAEIEQFVTTCRERGVRLLVTAHDLDNPHLSDQRDHHARLGLLVRAAQAVTTLTTGAADRLRRDFGVSAQVIPHPFIVPPDQARQVVQTARARRGGRRVGIFCKSLRSNTITDPRFFGELDRRLRAAGAQLHVYAHLDRAAHPLVAELSRLLGDRLHLHPRLDDAQLFQAVAAHDAVLLPYLRGSHSGWLEMCRDLAVTVVAPDCGFFADQADRPGGVVRCATADPESAAAATLQALDGGVLPMGLDRRAQYAEVLAAHHDLYTGGAGLETGWVA